MPTGGDPSGHGTKTWTFTWDGCSCGELGKVVLPSGREMEWTYDQDGRGLVTAVTMRSSGGQNPRTWTLAYKPWGHPADTGATYYESSRVTQFTDENSIPWSFAFAFEPTGKGGTTTIRIDPNGLNLYYDVTEDVLGRVTDVLEPPHDAEGTPSRASTSYKYVDWLTMPGYGLLSQIWRTRAHAQSPAIEAFTRDGLGNVVTVIDEHGRSTDLTVDAAGNVTMVELPDVSSVKPGSQTTQDVREGDTLGAVVVL